MYITDETIDKFIKEDIPYIDLTTHMLGIGSQIGKIIFTSRQDTVISGTDIVARIFDKLGIHIISIIPSGTRVGQGDVFIEAQGKVENLHMAWKVSLNILEYCSGIATRTRELVDKAKSINPKIEVVTTRKVFPGTKELSIQAVIDGGALPHRLGLSETILIFKQHINFLGGMDGLLHKLENIQVKACEKKIIVETESREEAIKLCQAGVEAIQLDKIPSKELKEIVNDIRKINPRTILIGTGGINADNVQEYAATGIDVINTTWIYFGKPADIGVTIQQ